MKFQNKSNKIKWNSTKMKQNQIWKMKSNETESNKLKESNLKWNQNIELKMKWNSKSIEIKTD